jgi:hypothetical protein
MNTSALYLVASPSTKLPATMMVAPDMNPVGPDPDTPYWYGLRICSGCVETHDSSDMTYTGCCGRFICYKCRAKTDICTCPLPAEFAAELAAMD